MAVAGWSDDGELFTLVRERLTTAVVGDILDRRGQRRQFLPQQVKPLKDYGVVVGRAMPVLEADVFDDREPFGKMFEALDGLCEGEIYLASGGSRNYAFFGELMAVAAGARGASGAILYGYHRDTARLMTSDFPVYSLGAFGQDQAVRGRVIDYRTTVEIGSAVVEPGDLLIADSDGVLVVPRGIESEAVADALEKVSIETDVREALRGGRSTRSVFQRYGVL